MAPNDLSPLSPVKRLTRLALPLMAALTLAAATTWAEEENSCNAAQGKRVFNKCQACHSTEAGVQLMGPSLASIWGQEAGSANQYSFSAAMKEATFVWNDITLDAFLKQPSAFIPGTSMPFGGIKRESDRQAVICYLKEISSAQ